MPHIATPPWADALGVILLHSVWEGALLAGLLRLALGVLDATAARARYAAACLCLAAMVIVPGLTFAVTRDVVTLPTVATIVPTSAPAASAGTEHRVIARDGTSPAAVVAPVRVRLPAAPVARLRPLLPVLAFGWLAGVTLLALRLVGGWGLTRRLARRDVVVPPLQWRARFEDVARAMRIRQPVRLLCSSRIGAPMLVGCWRPLVLLPVSALAGLPPWQVELLLRHELAHVQRLDPWVNLLQHVAELLLFHHPAVRWVSARIREEREHCCDDAVAAVAGTRPYVRALVAMAELRAITAATAPHGALGADGGELLGRVQRLLGEPPSRVGAATARPVALRERAALGALLILAVAISGWWMSASPVRIMPAVAVEPMPAPLVASCGPAAARASTTLCVPLGERVAALLRDRGVDGSVLVQDVGTGALVAYAEATPGRTGRLTERRTPGSIWKLSLAAIWLEQGLGDRRVACPAQLDIAGLTIRHWGAPAVAMTVDEVLVTSCNTAAALMALTLRDRLGVAGMRAALRRLGFPVEPVTDGRATTREHDFWAPSSTTWQRAMAPRVASLRMPARDDATAWAQLALGQRVELTPFHIARFLQAIANDGMMRHPTVARGPAPGARPMRRLVSPETAQRLQAAMRRVVTDGTARDVAATLTDARWSLGGKTATIPSHVGVGHDGWFAGVLFDERRMPRYVVVVQVLGRGRGGGIAATVAAELTRAIGGTSTPRHPRPLPHVS